MTDVTVIIPSKNRRKLLLRTLHSVLTQRDVDLEVLVVDDGGSDGTEAAVAALGDDRVRVIRHPQSRGVSAARNSGIAQAGAPWLAFVDDDDLWAPTKLRAQLDALAARPEAAWACTGSINVDTHCTTAEWYLPQPIADVGDELLRHNIVPGGGSGVLASRDLTREVGGFDEAISNLADWDFYIRLGLRSPVAAVESLHLGYLVRPEGMAHDVAQSQREYPYLEVKYSHERRRRGVQLDERDWLQYLAALCYSSGRRITGMRLHAELVLRHRHWRSLRTILMGVAPERLRLARARRYERPLPVEMADEARAWLAPCAEGWLD